MLSFIVVAALVLELAGGQNDPPQALTFREHLRFLRVKTVNYGEKVSATEPVDWDKNIDFS